MYPATINAQEVINLFEKMMQSDSKKRVLLLEGETKMGKTHLLGGSKGVFPILAQQYHACCITCDLTLPGQTDEAILRTACKDFCRTCTAKSLGLIHRVRKFVSPKPDLGTYLFPSYYPASQVKHSDPMVVYDH